MKAMRIFGIGSPFGDDQVGWRVVEWLQNQKSLQKNWHLECCDRPGLNLLNLIQDATVAILIDAVQSGAPLGTIHVWNNDITHYETDQLSTHGFGLSDALQLGKTLDCLPNTLIIYGIEINQLNNETLSESAENAAKKLTSRIRKEIKF